MVYEISSLNFVGEMNMEQAVQVAPAVQTDKRRIIAVKEYALRKRHDELYGEFLKYFEFKMMDYHTYMNSYETILDLLVLLLSLEGLSPSEIAGKIRDVTDHTEEMWAGGFGVIAE